MMLAKQVWLAIFAFVLCVGCSSVPAIKKIKPDTPEDVKQRRSLMIGKWYGEAPIIEGGHRKWIVDRFEDGTFKITFRIYDIAGKYREQIEVGEWGISGTIYFIITKGWIKDGVFIPSDPRIAYFYDAYRVISLDEKEFVFEAVEFGDKYRIIRVEPTFVFPESL